MMVSFGTFGHGAASRRPMAGNGARPVAPMAKPAGLIGGAMPRKSGGFDWNMIGDMGLAILAASDNGGSWAQAAPMIGQAVGASRERKAAKDREAQFEAELDALNLTPMERAQARLDPESFFKAKSAIMQSAGETKTGTFFDPKTGRWEMKPEFYEDGGFSGIQTQNGMVGLTQRPKSYMENTNDRRIDVDIGQGEETARSNRAKEGIERSRIGVAQQNAETARLNATRGGKQEEIWVPDENEPGGGRFIKAGYTEDGRYAPTDGDLPIGQNGLPAPRFNEYQMADPKAAHQILNRESKLMDSVKNSRDTAQRVKGLSDKFIKESKGYKFQGAGVGFDVGQALDMRTSNLTQITNELAPSMREPGSGAMSDRDVEMYKTSTVSVNNTDKGNANFALRANAVANRLNEYYHFLQQYRAEYGPGTLAEAERYWNQYANSPGGQLFDDNGDPNPNYMSSVEFFTGQAPAMNPFRREVGSLPKKGLSAEEQSELEQLRRELGQ